jgi:glutamate synthase (NADPH/NADH) small chain
MGDPTGFLKYPRREPGYRPRRERLRDFRAVERHLSHGDIMRQSARCMDCGTPFCHAYGCPLANLIPELNDCVYRGKWKSAFELLRSSNNFPEFTGRVCPAPCEAACVAGIYDEPVTIRQIELTIVEKAFENDYIVASPPAFRHDGKIAVIGAGPAGLTVADTLNRTGYFVTVFDESQRPGGILRYGIPDFKLEKWVVDRRIRLMEKEGVVFETGVVVGADISWRFLKDRFDVICLAGGARKPRDLSIPGRELSGIHFAMDYLCQQNMCLAGEKHSLPGEASAKEKTVVVIGGGDTGSDCVGTALRQGARKVYQFEILPKPPVVRPEKTPWPMWPNILRTTHAHEEGGERRWAVATKAFLGESRKVGRLQCCEVDWLPEGSGGELVPVEKPDSEFEVETDLVILALGFVGAADNRLFIDLGIEMDESGNVPADADNMTPLAGCFAAGDMRQGQSLVALAIADGRKTARGIERYFGGS